MLGTNEFREHGNLLLPLVEQLSDPDLTPGRFPLPMQPDPECESPLVSKTIADGFRVRRRRVLISVGRLTIVAIGVMAAQAVLYGPALIGSKVLLPLDELAQPGVYLPEKVGHKPPPPNNHARTDLVYQREPGRQFDVAEIHAGRMPSWMPYQFAGMPWIAAKYSPFWWLRSSVQSPVVLAWEEMAVALLAAFGTYAFCRMALSVGFWPAAIVAWCYPVTGFFIFWQGYGLEQGAAWLPWLLLAVDKTVRRARPWSAPALALVTGLMVNGGPPDIDGEALLAAGVYALWCFFDQYGRQWRRRRAIQSLILAAAAWMLGFLLAADVVWPLGEYIRTGARIASRSAGEEERPPVGLAGLPQTIFPDVYGSRQIGSYFMPPTEKTVQQGPPARLHAKWSGRWRGTCWKAPRPHTPDCWPPCSWPAGLVQSRTAPSTFFWLGLVVLALGWALNIPGVVDLLRAPGLNMLSHNRFVFVASFAVLAMAATGLEVLCQGCPPRRWWFAVPMCLLGGVLCWYLYRTAVPPEALASRLEAIVRQGGTADWVTDLADVHRRK